MESKKGLVHFVHGKESGPWGIKIQHLAKVAQSHGYAVESLDYSGIENPLERVSKLLEALSAVEDLILVGSSMGGYVATVASKTLNPKGLFLMAPAFFMPGYESEDLKPYARHAAIVHGWNDFIIPAVNSFRFAAQHNVELHLIDGDHRLNDQIALIEQLFSLFLENLA